METINPYAPPDTRATGSGPVEGKTRLWSRHVTIPLVLFPLWFVIGGAISMGGSRIEGLIDALGFLALFGYAGSALLIGILRSIRG